MIIRFMDSLVIIKGKKKKKRVKVLFMVQLIAVDMHSKNHILLEIQSNTEYFQQLFDFNSIDFINY
jgi:hypothetical protein